MLGTQVHPSVAVSQPGAAGEAEEDPPVVIEPATPDPDTTNHPMSVKQRRIMTAIFTLVAALLFADQNLLAPNLSAAADFFGFDDTEKDVKLGGYIYAGFFAVGAPAALIVGWLADHYNRRNMLFIVAIIGQVPCLCTIFVTEYWQFFLTRALTGVSVGGAFPLLYSLLGDFYPISQRAFVSAFIQIATGAGVFVGQMIAGWVGPSTDWRLPFVIVAVPAILCSVAMLFATKEPPRGACEEALQGQFTASSPCPYSEKITWAKMKLLIKVPSNWLIVMQGLPGSLTWGVFFTYFNDYLQLKNGWSAGVATMVITVFGVGAALGVIGGGFLGQWLYNKKKEWSPLFAGACLLVAIGPFMALINVMLADLLVLALFIAFVGGMFGSVAGPNIKATLLNVNDPESRGVALALSTMTDDLGKALGPAIVSAFISALGRRTSFNIAILCGIPAGLMIMIVAFFLRKDEAGVQDRLEQWKKNHESIEAATRELEPGDPSARPSCASTTQDLTIHTSPPGSALAAGVRTSGLSVNLDGSPPGQDATLSMQLAPALPGRVQPAEGPGSQAGASSSGNAVEQGGELEAARLRASSEHVAEKAQLYRIAPGQGVAMEQGVATEPDVATGQVVATGHGATIGPHAALVPGPGSTASRGSLSPEQGAPGTQGPTEGSPLTERQQRSEATHLETGGTKAPAEGSHVQLQQQQRVDDSSAVPQDLHSEAQQSDTAVT